MSLLLSPSRYPNWLGLILALLALAGCGSGVEQRRRAQPPPKPDVTVGVQLDRHLSGRHSASGFLHALTARLPRRALVAPLAPRLWRSDLRRASLARADSLGARYELVLSDLWGYPKDHWSGRGPPWSHPREWMRLVRDVARSLRGRRVVFDVWNEPDDPGYFGGGLRRYLQVFRVARRALELALGPGARIVGPSTSHFLPGWSRALARCCRPAFLSWHATDPALDPSDISRQLRELRRRIPRAPPFQINEFGSPAGRYEPGKAVGYLAAIEDGGAEAAARACWSPQECAPASLDGLLTTSGEPRSAWWAHRWYALAPPERRVRATVSDASVVALASRGPLTRVLLGRVQPGAGRPLNVAVRLQGLAGGEARVLVERLPDSGQRALRRPDRIAAQRLRVSRGAIRVRVPGLRPHEAALVTVSAA